MYNMNEGKFTTYFNENISLKLVKQGLTTLLPDIFEKLLPYMGLVSVKPLCNVPYI